MIAFYFYSIARNNFNVSASAAVCNIARNCAAQLAAISYLLAISISSYKPKHDDLFSFYLFIDFSPLRAKAIN